MEQVFRFWKLHGFGLAEIVTGVTFDRPDIGMGLPQFLQDTHMVQHALKVWLREEADRPASAAFVPMLALWFRCPDCPDLDGEEEDNFLAQWKAYSKWRRQRRG